jgi:predicted transcriptional regulator
MKNKINMSKRKVKFTKLPNELFNMNLSSGSFSLYSLCLSLSETFDPSVDWLVKKIGLSRWTINRSFKELVDKKLLKCIRKGSHHSKALYSFNKVDEWIL